MTTGGLAGRRLWLALRLGWFATFVVAAVLIFGGAPRVGFGILGGVATLVGLCLVLNFADVAAGGVEQMRQSRWSAPAMANVAYLRLFGVAFGGVGVVFLVLALTNNIHWGSRAGS